MAVGVAVALAVSAAPCSDVHAASAASASGVADGRSSSATHDGPSATDVAQDLAACESAVSVERPPLSALATCRGVATAPWETNHTRIDAHILLGRALGRLDRFAEALDTVQAAKRLNADDPDIYGFEAWVSLNLQRLEDARAAAQTAIRLDPRGAAGYLGLAFVNANLGLFEQAVEVAERGFGASRNSRERPVLGAFSALRTGGNLDAAARAVQDFADRVSEVRAEAAFLQSGILRRRGDSLAAAQILRRAIDAGPDTPGKRIALADTLRELGRDGEAIGHMQRALQLGPLPEVAADVRKTLASSEARLPSSVPLADHLADVGRVLPLRRARTIRVAPGYAATCRYQRAMESVTTRRRQTDAQINLSTHRDGPRVAMRIQAALSRQATGGRSPVELTLAAGFGANGKLESVRVAKIVASGLNDRQKRRAAAALGDRISEVLRLRYAGGTYRQDDLFSANTTLLRRAYQRQFRAYDKGAQITAFEDRSRLVGITRRSGNEYYVIDTRLRGESFVAGAEILLEAKGYMLIDALSGLIAEQRETMVTKVVDRGIRIVESESAFTCDIKGGQTPVAKAAPARERVSPQRVAVVDAELIPINQPYVVNRTSMSARRHG